MTQYDGLNVKLSNSQLKNETEVVLRLSPTMIGNSDDETNFPHKLLVTERQVSHFRNAFSNNSSTGIKLLKIHLSKMIKLGGFPRRLLGSLLKTGLPLIKSLIKPLAKSVLIPVELTAAASAADAGTHKKILGSGTTTQITSNDEMEDIMKIVKSLEDTGIFLKGVTETVQNEVKEQKGRFLSMLLVKLGASLLGNILAGKGLNKKSQGKK